jgi:hypothetical protein
MFLFYEKIYQMLKRMVRPAAAAVITEGKVK